MAETALRYPTLAYDGLELEAFGKAWVVEPWTRAARARTASYRDDVPQWLDTVNAELRALEFYCENWDSYGAPPISKSNLSAAREVLTGMVGRSTPRPSVVPTSGGSVQLEWHTRGMDIEVLWLTPAKLRLTAEASAGHFQPIDELELGADLRVLEKAIRELSSRTG